MNKSHLLGVICAVLCTFTTVSANAAIVTVPVGLNPGDMYRLAFVTSTTRDARSSNIADYNNFVTGVANTQVDLVSLGTTWSAIASTHAVDARDNTNTNPGSGTGVPIYRLDGGLIAASNAGVWDGSALINFNESGSGVATSTRVWTGTLVDGVQSASQPLGSENPRLGCVGFGGGGWVNCADDSKISSNRLYAISGVLTVAAVPIPAAAWLFGSGLLGLIGVARRRKAA